MLLEEVLKAARDTRVLIVGSGVLSRVSELFREQFPDKKAIVIADNNTWRAAGKDVAELLKTAGITQDDAYIYTDPELYAEYGYVDALVAVLKDTDAVPIAAGSGTINDLVKLASHLTGRQYLCVATAASVDGYTSFGASVTANGAKQTFDCPAPQACLADTDIIGKAPAEMTAAGYADLFAKITAGADWILADRLEIDPIDHKAWSIVQDGLHDALSDPEGVKNRKSSAIAKLTEGLMMSGFAMQWLRSSRPASGAEHYFSHLWDMEHHRFGVQHVSHGFQVSIGTVAITALYEQMLDTPIETLDVEAACRAWPSLAELENRAVTLFKESGFSERCLNETRAKYITREQLAQQLCLLKERQAEIKQAIGTQLVPYETARQRLQLVGAPVEPEQTGISMERLRQTFLRAPFIRSRFTILDLAVRTCYMPAWLDVLFGYGGRFFVQPEIYDK
ncbi:MAG: sn-glycerol-1-phosphate dehydrogenase [Tannerella sp.]|jgi:glycerol-1-phosphate dehydrogenase [NAD(P)+]|nr:sn-glycerol-1-phosphate dehydrogenase [Tannerella sp.]